MMLLLVFFLICIFSRVYICSSSKFGGVITQSSKKQIAIRKCDFL